jgi:hypothetical protein
LNLQQFSEEQIFKWLQKEQKTVSSSVDCILEEQDTDNTLKLEFKNLHEQVGLQIKKNGEMIDELN